MKRHLIACIYILFLIDLPYAQEVPLVHSWDRYYGVGGSEEVHAMIEDVEGNIILVGVSHPGEYKSSEFLFMKISPAGDLLFRRDMGGVRADGANAVIQTWDGGYVLGGFTESHWKVNLGKRDAMIIKIDRFGQVVWDRVLGSGGSDDIFDIAQDANGRLIVAGKADKHPWLAVLTGSGNIFWEKNFTDFEGQLNGVCARGSLIYATGTVTSGRSESLFVSANRHDSSIVWQNAFDKYVNGTDILIAKSGRIVVAGEALSGRSKMDGVVLEISEDGYVTNEAFVGDEGIDGLAAICRRWDGYYATAGYSFSHLKGARRSTMWMQHLDAHLKPVPLDQQYWGGKSTDAGKAVLQSHMGSVWLAGNSASGGAKGTDVWVVKFDAPAPGQHGILGEIGMIPEGYIISGVDQTLDPGENGYIQLKITNTSEYVLCATRLEVNAVNPGFRIPTNIRIPIVDPGESATIHVPFDGTRELVNGTVAPSLSLCTRDYTRSFPKLVQIPVRGIAEPQLILGPASFALDSDDGTISCVVAVQNSGNAAAKDVVMRFTTNYTITPVHGDKIAFDDIAVGATKSANFTFRPNTQYLLDSISITAIVSETSVPILQQKQYVYRYSLELPAFAGSNEQSRESLRDNTGVMSDKTQQIIWHRPDPDQVGYHVRHALNHVDIELHFTMPGAVTADDVLILLNGQQATPGDAYKLRNVKLQTEDGYHYTYENRVNLIKGRNKIVVVVNTSSSQYKSMPMVVDFDPPRHNLHVYAFGIPQKDLEYTKKDAEDLLKAFAGQQGKIFEEVNMHLYNIDERTNITSLGKAIQDIAYDYSIRESIGEGDVVVVYLSSHGFIADDGSRSFRIAASDFDHLYARTTSLDFSQVLNALDPLPCKKLIMLDACYSGAIAQNVITANTGEAQDPGEIALSRAIAQVVQQRSKPELQIIVSSGPGEVSYEDASWENSAFMLAIIEALTVVKEKSREVVDSDRNGILTTAEIFSYIDDRIPEIVRTKRPRPKYDQRPAVYPAPQEWPIYALE